MNLGDQIPVFPVRADGTAAPIEILTPASTVLALVGTLLASGQLTLTGLPTSPAGLTTGRIWSNGGVLMVV